MSKSQAETDVFNPWQELESVLAFGSATGRNLFPQTNTDIYAVLRSEFILPTACVSETLLKLDLFIYLFF